jgi:hypothetical protein
MSEPVPAAGLPDPARAAQAVEVLLQPLARLMIDHGLQLPSMVELLKKALVAEALHTYGLQDKGSSDTRIALLTGVHRKDVKRLRDAPPEAGPTPPLVPMAASVVARWISEPRYLQADRTPRALARTPGKSTPGEPDFTALVAEISRDVGARAVLDELVRLGVVQVTPDGLVRLVATAFVPQQGRDESFHFLARNVSDHLATAAHNLAPGREGPPLLEQSAFAQGLTAAQAEQLHQAARQLWAAALQQFLQSATVAEERSRPANGPGTRVRFGVYFHQDTEASPPSAPLPPAKGRHKPARKPQP